MNSVSSTLEFDRICEYLSSLAVSPLGRESCFHIEMIRNRDDLRTAQNQLSEFRDLLDYDQSIPIEGFSDLRPVLKKLKIEGGYLQVEELVAIAQTLAVVRQLDRFFSSRKEKIPFLISVTQNLVPLKDIEEEIGRCIDKDLSVRDKATTELAAIRNNLRRAQESARRRISTIQKNLKSSGVLQEDIITVRDGRMVLVVKEEFRRKVKGLVHDQSASGSSLYIEPLETVDDNNRIRQLQGQEKKEIERILRLLTDLVRTREGEIDIDLRQLGALDFLYAKARFSRQLNAHQPELVEEHIISIQQGRHPLLLLRMGEKSVVPIDVVLGELFNTLIISGPNAGGKTVALKTIGVLTHMALCGLHIPALPHSKIGLVNSIYASIGDQQSIENDLSTFSSHLTDLKHIAERADRLSLVLIDEVGSGTDPEEGTALARSLLEHLSRIGCLTVVTTHQSPLKAFAFQTENVENGSMEFDVETLQATYRFRVGIPGSSYAFEIAHRLGLPDPLTERARQMVGSSKDELEGLILELGNKIQKYNTLLREVNLKQTELDGLKKLYRERAEVLKRDQRQIIRKAVREAEEILRQSNAAVERAIREIKEAQAARETIRKAKKELEEEHEKLRTAVEPELEEKSTEPVKKGDFVRWEKNSSLGTVLQDMDKQGRVLLQIEGKKIRLPIKELQKVTDKKKSGRTVQINVEQSDIYKNEIDLRGQRTEDAIEQVDRFLDEVLLTGLKQVRIIHGKGTGTLRANIGDFLAKHPHVARIRPGNWDEGNIGVTIVELKDY